MGKALTVLGLDAVDYRLAQRWDCENLLLNNHRELKTFSYSLDVPATLEVWPSIATGQPPQEHGVVVNQIGWDNRTGLNIVVKLAQLLPDTVHSSLLQLKKDRLGSSIQQTEAAHIFDRGSVYNWPGLTPCLDWNLEGEWFSGVTEGNLSEEEFRRRHLGSAGKGIGWLAGQSLANVPISGAHIHYLDHMGHLYGKRPETLRSAYMEMDALVGWLRQQVDRLVIISDHGMQTTSTDDSDPGVHSSHALMATTEFGELPTNVMDIRDWLDERVVEDTEERESKATVDAPMEHLRDLGYL
ncbi:alkaline phosphatase family protein [Halococcus sp. IIIV-5B]|uniref:alkaline phosphatase family protein n=1 Tax=Halococcus sp. IIIV-5B TaxID=2321230 RepID=UPI000E749EA8|nr:alkaline phosphatase family protein [Halococcus sp. IIIV-5B]RJT07991.1 hypothetical protein D3261_01215 [Halococcus sp. IIIV-5B]